MRCEVCNHSKLTVVRVYVTLSREGDKGELVRWFECHRCHAVQGQTITQAELQVMFNLIDEYEAHFGITMIERKASKND